MAAAFKKFTNAQRHDPLWRRTLKPMIESRLESLRTTLESSTLSPEVTASIRANIKLCRELLALEANPAPSTLDRPAESDRGSDD